MSVVNVKVANIRKSGFANLQEWMNDENNIYVGRAGIVFIDGVRFPKQSSMFANPFKIGKDGTREEVIEIYKNALEKQIAENPNMKEELLKLKGKNLGCWCAPEPCHGDILLELIAKYDTPQKIDSNNNP
jgi:hypothetical protein